MFHSPHNPVQNTCRSLSWAYHVAERRALESGTVSFPNFSAFLFVYGDSASDYSLSTPSRSSLVRIDAATTALVASCLMNHQRSHLVPRVSMDYFGLGML